MRERYTYPNVGKQTNVVLIWSDPGNDSPPEAAPPPSHTWCLPAPTALCTSYVVVHGTYVLHTQERPHGPGVRTRLILPLIAVALLELMAMQTRTQAKRFTSGMGGDGGGG